MTDTDQVSDVLARVAAEHHPDESIHCCYWHGGCSCGWDLGDDTKNAEGFHAHLAAEQTAALRAAGLVAEPAEVGAGPPAYGTEDYRRHAVLFNDITRAPSKAYIALSDRLTIQQHLWAQGWRREVRPEDVTE